MRWSVPPVSSPPPSPQPPLSITVLDEFTSVTLRDLKEILSNSSLSTCKLDILPSKFLLEVFGVVAPCLLPVVDESLLSVLDYFKQTCIQPLLQKPGLDPTLLSNYRPKWPLISETIDQVLLSSCWNSGRKQHVWQIVSLEESPEQNQLYWD